MNRRSAIFFFLLLFFGFSGYCQTKRDSVPLGPDSVKTVNHDTITPATKEAFPPLYRRNVNYIVKTNLGITYTGFIVEETEFYIVIEDRISRERREVRRGEIVSVKIFSTRQSYESIIGENYHAGNYMLASSAFLFSEGKVSSTYHWFLLDNLDYAITDNFAVNVTSILIYPMAVGVKCAFQLDDMNYIGGNVFGMGNILAGNNANGGTSSAASSFFLGYGGMARYTRGTSNHNITIGGGLFALNSDVVYSTPQASRFYNVFFSNVAYCSRLNEHVALNLEGWFLPKAQVGFAGVGFKLVANQESCWTFGCYGLVDFQNNAVNFNYKALPLPYIGMTQKF